MRSNKDECERQESVGEGRNAEVLAKKYLYEGKVTCTVKVGFKLQMDTIAPPLPSTVLRSTPNSSVFTPLPSILTLRSMS